MPLMICYKNIAEQHFSIIYGFESIEVKTFTCFVGYIYCQFDSFLDEMLVLDSKYLVINVQVLNMLYVGKLRTKTCLGYKSYLCGMIFIQLLLRMQASKRKYKSSLPLSFLISKSILSVHFTLVYTLQVFFSSRLL